VAGAANTAVVALLADWLSVPKRDIVVVQGAAARDKTVAIASDDPTALAAGIERRIATVERE
jgi:uncharacterized protein YggU (UPF0235/DUF167 family)